MTQKREVGKELGWDGALELQAGIDPAEKGSSVWCLWGWGSHTQAGRSFLLSCLPAGCSLHCLEGVEDICVAEALPSLPRAPRSGFPSQQWLLLRLLLELWLKTLPKHHQSLQSCSPHWCPTCWGGEEAWVGNTQWQLAQETGSDRVDCAPSIIPPSSIPLYRMGPARDPARSS